MTPVQLPEVPARSGTVTEKIKPGLYKMSDAYTADQLRAYATEAVRLNMKQFLPACEALKREAIREQIGGLTRGDPGKIANADRLIAILTQPEQNSGR